MILYLFLFKLCSFSEPNPRKGTETCIDHNSVGYLFALSFSEPNPRKGTETEFTSSIVPMNSPCFSEPNPRKGTETQLSALSLQNSSLAGFSEPNPRKGTETASKLN